MEQKLLLIVYAFVMAFPISALSYNQFKVDGVIYEIIAGTNNVKVTYDTDKLKLDEYGQRIGNTYTGVVNVPGFVQYNGTTYTVTEVGEFAFAGGPGLNGVNLPETITTIGMSGFYGNDGLTTFSLPNSLKSIGYYAFRNCYNLSSVNFPEGLEVIGGDAFTHDRSLTELILPSSLQQIDGYAFCACIGVKRVVLQDSDVPLIKNPNYGCQTIFDQMEVDYAYIGRTCYTDGASYQPIRIKTKELVFGDAVSSFSLSQFYPEHLEKLSIPQTCNKLYFSDFQNSTALKHIVIKDGNSPIVLQAYVKSTPNEYGASYEYFPCFANCPLESAYVGRSFKQENGLDGTQAFYNNKTLKNLVIGPLVTSLPKYGFQRCQGLETVEFSKSLASIGDACFADCHLLKSVELPNGLTEVADRVFDGCFALENVQFGPKVTSIGEMAFYYCGLNDLTLPASVKQIGASAFAGNKSLVSITLPEGLETIDQRAFQDCEAVEDLTIPSTVKLIKWNAFSNLKALKRVRFENSADDLVTEYVSSYSSGPLKSYPIFSGSTANLEEIYMGRVLQWDSWSIVSGTSRQTLYDYIDLWGETWNITSTPTVIFGTKLNMTSTNVFRRFPGIKKVICEGTSQIPYYYEGTFNSIENIPVYVPNGYVEKYINQYYWKGFKSVQANIPATSISLNKTSVSIQKDESIILIPSVYPSNAVDADVLWCSSDESVATVSNSGEVTGIGIGSAIMTAFMPNYPELTASCIVDVLQPITKISLGAQNVTIAIGNELHLDAFIEPQTATNKRLKWESSNTNVATVDQDGNVKAIAPGNAVVTVKSTDGSDISASCNVTVIINSPNFYLTGVDDVTYTDGDVITVKYEINARARYFWNPELVVHVEKAASSLTGKSNFTFKATADVQYKVQFCGVDGSCVMIPVEGVVKTGMFSKGDNIPLEIDIAATKNLIEHPVRVELTISDGVQTQNYTLNFVIEPKDPSDIVQVSSINLSHKDLTLNEGATAQLTADVMPDEATNKTLVWESSNPNVATVDQNGKVTSIAQGSAFITVRSTDGSDISAFCNLTVVKLVESITLSESEIVMKAGEFKIVTATVNPDNATNKSLIWISSDVSVASVQNGIVLAHAEGEAIITVLATDDSGVKAECKVNISGDAGIDSVTCDDVKVYVSSSTICIDNLPADELVRIVQTNGTEIFRAESVGDRISFRPSGKGVFIVILGNRSYKVTVI